MTPTGSDYDQWAWLYNKTLGPDYCAQKMVFLDRALLRTLAPDARVLDLCCGTGQMIVPLIERGFDVTGLDLSTDMLKFAEKNASGAHFVQGDARSFSFDQQFNAVLCTSASLNHMSGKADLAAVFASVNHSLEPGGTFVFDINHPAQLTRFWRNQPAAGEIADSYAWLITPRYDANTAKGAFRVDMYVQPEGQEPRLASKIVDLLSRIRFLWRLKLRRLARFGASHPQWEHKSSDYPIYGHDLNTVMDMLGKAGFDPTLQTLECSPNVTERDAAFFVCTKTAEISRVQEAAE